MRKGSQGSQVITLLSNYGSGGSSYTFDLSNHGYSSGSKLVELYTCSSLQVDSSGNIPVPMSSGLPRTLVPASWVSGSGLCSSTPTSTLTTTTTATPTEAVCAPGTATATVLPVVFEEKVQTVYGENVYIAGSIAQLGNWDPAKAVKLSADKYTAANPLWTVTVSLPVGTSFEYKFLKKEPGGDVVWESDPNRQFTVPGGCEGEKKTVGGSWR